MPAARLLRSLMQAITNGKHGPHGIAFAVRPGCLAPAGCLASLQRRGA